MNTRTPHTPPNPRQKRRETHADTRARTAQEPCTRVAQRLSLPMDSAPSGGDKDGDPRTTSGPPSRETLTELTGVTVTVTRRGPAEAEPTVKRPGEYGTASALVISRSESDYP